MAIVAAHSLKDLRSHIVRRSPHRAVFPDILAPTALLLGSLSQRVAMLATGSEIRGENAFLSVF